MQALVWIVRTSSGWQEMTNGKHHEENTDARRGGASAVVMKPLYEGERGVYPVDETSPTRHAGWYMTSTKPYVIAKRAVWESVTSSKANGVLRASTMKPSRCSNRTCLRICTHCGIGCVGFVLSAAGEAGRDSEGKGGTRSWIPCVDRTTA